MKTLFLLILCISMLYSVDESPNINTIKIEVVKSYTKEEIQKMGYNTDIVLGISYRIVVLPSGERILYTTYFYKDQKDPQKTFDWSNTYRAETTTVKL